MKRTCLLALTTATFLAACSTGKPAVSDSLATTAALDSSPGIATPPSTAGSQVVASTEQAPAPSKPSSPATRPVPAAARPVPAATKPVPATTPSVAPVPVVAAPATKPTVQPVTPAPQVAILPSPLGQDAAGKTLYEENCRKCHGVRGVPPKAITAKFPKIMAFDAAFFAKRSDDSVVKVLTNGKDENMKSFKDKLSRAQMFAVAAYIRLFAK
jgi:mono/diheme cytochrome c family protein